jgi:prolyl oligopeptidase
MARSLYLASLIVLMFSCKPTGNDAALQYPESRKDTSIADDYFGTRVPDPYRWLENDSSAETADWVKRQNTFTQDYLSTIPFRNTIKKRLTELFDFEKYSTPFTRGQYTYYFRNSGLQNQSALYRESPGSAAPELFIDPNTFSADGTTSMSGLSFSSDGSMVAYNLSEGGSDWQKTTVMDAVNKRAVTDTVEVKFSRASWRGNTGFYYSSYPRSKTGNVLTAKNENHKLFFHRLGTPQSGDIVAFGDDAHPFRYVSGQVSEDQRWLIVSAANQTYGNAVYLLSLTDPQAKWVTVVADTKNSHSIVDVDDVYLYIQTDKDAPTGRVVMAPLKNPQPEHWQTLIPAQKEVLSASAAGGSLFCSYLKDAISVVKQYNRNGTLIRKVPLPGLGTADGFDGQQQDTAVHFIFESYTSPRKIFRMSLGSGAVQLFKESKVKYHPEDYESRQVFYTSKDSTRIPMIITYKKGLKWNGKNPCLLYGYGGFSISITPRFQTANIVLLENGGIYAVPNIRGGGEYGEAWHEQGIQQKKQNVFDDFIAAAQYLINTTPHAITLPWKEAATGDCWWGLASHSARISARWPSPMWA